MNAAEPMKPYYKKASIYEWWWCDTHKRRATHILVREGMEDEHCCDPDLGGITMVCKTKLYYI